jgi:hypothetical protein
MLNREREKFLKTAVAELEGEENYQDKLGGP